MPSSSAWRGEILRPAPRAREKGGDRHDRVARRIGKRQGQRQQRVFVVDELGPPAAGNLAAQFGLQSPIATPADRLRRGAPRPFAPSRIVNSTPYARSSNVFSSLLERTESSDGDRFGVDRLQLFGNRH